MAVIVDTRGLNCPEPVIRTKKALGKETAIEVLVDNDTALENVRRLARSRGCEEKCEKESTGTYRIFISKTDDCTISTKEEKSVGTSGPTIAVFSSDTMGRGDEYLGEILMKAFLHTLTEMEQPPDMVIRYNTGIKLAVKETQTATDLQALADKGSSVLVCGTCANFFNLKESINVGTISNMYDIAGALVKAGRIVCP